MIKVIIFDVDGVLDENYDMHFEFSQKKTLNLTREEHRKLFEGNIHIERAKLAHRDTGFDMINHMNSSRIGKKIKESTKKVLEQLAKTYIVGVISSGLESGINDYLTSNDCLKYVTFVYGYETHTLKDEKFKIALNKYNFEKSECVYITDTLGDIKEATKIGIRCIGYTKGYHERERLAKGEPIAIIDDLDEIDKIVTKLNLNKPALFEK
ncbi:MAG: HAD hydrolase-like protein [Candidatus Woesearchaeota archaeon]|jgi:phosphoglycolate phosphatase-like HAD superfamily hydrolase